MWRLPACGLLVLAVGVVLWFVFTGGGHKQETYSPDVLSELPQAPDFSFPDATGKEVVLSEVQSLLRIVHFWASWDPSSAEGLHALAEIAREHSDVAVIALNRDVVPSEGQALLARLELGDMLVFAYDKNDTYYRELGGYNMPETVFLAPGGEILEHVRGPMSEEEFRSSIERWVR